MRAVITDDGSLHVTLSERNLKTLLLKLGVEGSARTLVREGDGGREIRVVVTAESDEVHYQDRRPGPVHPREEAKL